MEFYKKSKKKVKGLSEIDKAKKRANNKLAWDLISKGADVNAVFKSIDFTIDNFMDIDELEPANKPKSSKRPAVPIPPPTRYLVG